MPRKIKDGLSAQTVKYAGPGSYVDGRGLRLVVKASGARSWVYRFMLAGKSREVGLGSAAGKGAVSLADARKKAGVLRGKVEEGIDPIAEREREAVADAAKDQADIIAGITFKSVAEDYVRANEGSWKNAKHRQQWRNTLADYVYPSIGEIPVADVRTTHVMQILEPIWTLKPETASRVRGRIETVLDAAKAREYRSGENPARWRGHLAQLLPARARLSRGHHKATPYAEVPAFVARLREREAVAALALEFAILTAARSGEVLGATWQEIDIARAVWTIPAERMKAGREHIVPLSSRAVAILEETAALGREWLFPGTTGGKLSSMAMTMLLRRMKADATAHGTARSSFRDWAAECTDFPHEVCEMALAHMIGNKAEAAYRRGNLLDKRRGLMEAWASYCAGEAVGGNNVVAFPRVAER